MVNNQQKSLNINVIKHHVNNIVNVIKKEKNKKNKNLNNINISDLMNRSRGEYAYTILDLDNPAPDSVIRELEAMDGVLRVRKVR